MKYGRALILIIVYFIMGLVPLFVIPGNSYPFTILLPGSNAGMQVTILFFFYPVVLLISGVIFSYLMGPLYLFLHKMTIGRKMTYGQTSQPASETVKFRQLGKGFFPGLLAINFASMLIPYLSPIVLYDYVATWGSAQVAFFTFIVALLFTAVFASLLFAGVWALNDAGIVYSNQATALDAGQVLEVRGVGGWFHQLLKGYAGISVIFTYLVIITEFWNSMQGVPDLFSLILLGAIMFPIPIYAALAVLPTIVVLDVLKNRRNAFMVNFAKKLGITEEIEYPR